MDAIDAFNEFLVDEGHWVLAAGLESLSQAYVIPHDNDDAGTKFGPANLTEQFMSRFWIIEAETPAIAHGIAQLAAKACRRDVEVRAFLGTA